MKEDRFDEDSHLVAPIQGRGTSRERTAIISGSERARNSLLHKAVDKVVTPIQASPERARAVPFTEIGFGRPLSLTIESIFPGSASWHDHGRIGAVLVASAV
ncbi:hypothetical protein, partial [Escherichia coli]|uniref:hypothetical protein n=1 Tax=Escherichia coli TaxID=562 RepID=UPI0032E4B05F